VLAPLQQPIDPPRQDDLKQPSSPQAKSAAADPLTAEERTRRRQLILIVERGLSQFLAVGAALLELRSSRLYRETHDTFESFCRETFGLARSTTDQVIRSASTAQLLINNGAELPPNTTEAVVRPVSSLPSPELQLQAWRLVQAVSPGRTLTQPLVSKVCRTVRNAIEPEGANGTGHKPRHREHPRRERPFVQAAQRLGSYTGFSPEIVTSHIEKLPSAWSVYAACGKLIERCKEVRSVLAKRFPELCQPTH
jgi:hypothetical protein